MEGLGARVVAAVLGRAGWAVTAERRMSMDLCVMHNVEHSFDANVSHAISQNLHDSAVIQTGNRRKRLLFRTGLDFQQCICDAHVVAIYIHTAEECAGGEHNGPTAHVSLGEAQSSVCLFALSTCVWGVPGAVVWNLCQPEWSANRLVVVVPAL